MGSCSSCCCPQNNASAELTTIRTFQTLHESQESDIRRETFRNTESLRGNKPFTFTEHHTQTDEYTLTEGQTQTDEYTLTEGQTQTDEYTLTEGQTQTEITDFPRVGSSTATSTSVAVSPTPEDVSQTFPKTAQLPDTTQPPAEIRDHTCSIGNAVVSVRRATNVLVCNDANGLAATLLWQTEEEKTRNGELENIIHNLLTEHRRELENMLQQNERLQMSAQQISRESQEEQARRYTELLQQSAEKIASLQENLREETRLGEERLAALRASHEEERQKERNQVITFVLAVESRLERIMNDLGELQLTQVSENLYNKFNVRLVAVTCGLTFVMETTKDQWARLVEHQVEIQGELLGLIPEEHHDDVSWQEMAECPSDNDLRVGNPLPPSMSSIVTRLQREHDTDQTLPKHRDHEEQTVPEVPNVEHSSSPSPSSSRPVQASSEERAQAEPGIDQTLPKHQDHEEQTVPEVPNVEHSTSTSLSSSRSVQVSFEERAQAQPDIEQTLPKRRTAVTFDPVTSTLEPGPTVEMSVEGDMGESWITAMISYLGAVFMADIYNSKIKVFSLTAPHQLLHCLPVDGDPWGLAMVTGRQLLAVTLQSVNRIQLIDVTATSVVGQSIKTHRRYWGVGSCDERTLVVSCPRDGQLPASVDIITLEGEVVRRVTSSDEVEDLVNPWFLCVSGGTIYISDRDSHCVHQTDMETGQLTTLPRHPKLENPRQVTVDPGGNLYVASYDGQCVLVRTAAGEWRELLQGERHGEGDRVYARCVCVTDTGLLLFAPKHTNVHPARLHQKKSP